MDLNTIFIHYGADAFDSDKFYPIKNSWVKPSGGLWASPKTSDRGWEYFCRIEDYKPESLNKSFEFKIKKNSRVCVIDSLFDLHRLPSYDTEGLYPRKYLDFEKLEIDYDAIWLTWNGQCETRMPPEILGCQFDLYGWDVETLLVMNKDIIELLNT